MIELIVSVCLLAEPGRCKDVHLSFAEETLTPMKCLMGAQVEIAKWAEIHPNWSIEKWKCGRPSLAAKA